jgi:hypothetical protein
MTKMVQIRNVPEELHEELCRRAKARRLTLSDYLKELLEREVCTPSREEYLARLLSRAPVRFKSDIPEMIRAEREGRLTD